MSEIKNIPIVEVKSPNYLDILPCLTIAIKTSLFISIDLELSGLGNRKLLMHKDIDERYKSISDLARTRSIISFGISCFRLNPKTLDDKAINFTVQTFDLLLLCLDDYVVESSSLTFLLDHGFDFNAQYKYGLPYYRGNDKTDITLNNLTVRYLFNEIIKYKKPLIIHNGLIDLIFIYQNLYSDLPMKMPTFLTDLSCMFPSVIYDTKYIADFEMRLEASYLEYIFRKSQRQNCIRSKEHKNYCKITFLNYDGNQPVILLPCSLTSLPCLNDLGKTIVCQTFANHGWCTNGTNCTESHDVDLILDADENSKNKNMNGRSKEFDSNNLIEKSIKNKDKNNKDSHKSTEYDSEAQIFNKTNQELIENDSKVQISDANFDNFMDNISINNITADNYKIHKSSQNKMEHDGFSNNVSTLLENIPNDNESNRTGKNDCVSNGDLIDGSNNSSNVKNSESNSKLINQINNNRINGHKAGLDAFMTGYIFGTFLVRKKALKDGEISEEFCEEFGNKVYLGGKDFPLQVIQSSYSKPSKNHILKYNKLMAELN